MEEAKNINNYINKSYKTIKVSEDLIDIIKNKLGDEVIWYYDEDDGELFIVKKPDSYTEALSGLGENMWKSVNGVEYIKQERDLWQD
jgi:prophage tail gpP-like protein